MSRHRGPVDDLAGDAPIAGPLRREVSEVGRCQRRPDGARDGRGVACRPVGPSFRPRKRLAGRLTCNFLRFSANNVKSCMFSCARAARVRHARAARGKDARVCAGEDGPCEAYGSLHRERHRQRERPGPTRTVPSKGAASASAPTGTAPAAEESVGFARAPMRRGALDYT